MTPAGFTLLCCIAAPLVASEPEVPAPAPRKLSSHLTEEIRAALPTFQPPVTTAAADPGSPLQNAYVLELPRMTVTEKRMQAMAPDTLLSKDELGRKMEREYLNSLADVSDLNLILNSFSIPLVSPSVKVRAREAYFDKRISAEFARLFRLAEKVREIDPVAAAKLERDMDTSRLPGK